MKFAVVVLACVLAAANGQRRAFASAGSFNRPFGSQAFGSFGSQGIRAQPYKPAPTVQVSQPVYTPVVAAAPTYSRASAYSGNAASANILKSGNEINPDGAYNYFFETDNGIAAQAQGSPRNFGGNPPVVPVVAQGSFSWTSPEGEPISITYVADENGYQPQGNAIPTPPPVPPQIARALDYIARNAPRK